MTQVAIVADDLTGAADAAAPFAECGLATAIPLIDDVRLLADVLAISTASPDLPPGDAAAAVRAAIAGRAHGGGPAPALIYKKLDSALRGQLGAELIAAMEALGERRALVAPALPSEGRTTLGGRQHVGGVPLEQSS